MSRGCFLILMALLYGCSDNGKTKDLGSDQAVTDLNQGDSGKLDVHPDSAPSPDLQPDGPGLLPSAWKPMSLPTSSALYGIWGIGSTNVYAVGKNGTILQYDGVGWKKMANSETADLYGISGQSQDLLYAVGEGMILKYDGSPTGDGGAPKGWTKEGSYSSYSFRGIWVTASHFWAVGQARVLRYKSVTSTSTSWSSVYFTSSLDYHFNAMWGPSTDEALYLVGNNGLLLQCTGTSCSNSSNWTKIETGVSSNLMAIWGSSASNIYVVGLDGTILHYDGDKWGAVNANTPEYLNGVWGSGESDIFVAAHSIFKGDESILHYNGSAWSKMPPPQLSLKNNAVWGTSSTDVFIAGDSGIFHYDGSSN